MPEPFFLRIKERAARECRPASHLVIDVVGEYLDRHFVPEPPAIPGELDWVESDGHDVNCETHEAASGVVLL